MKKFTTVLLFFSLITGSVFAEDEFQPSGSPFTKIFFNFHSDLEGEKSAFEIQRAYFGYKYKMTKEFSGHLTLDVGSPEIELNDSVDLETSLNMTAYLKTAGITYKKGNLTLDAGLIGLQQFKIQESHWGHRYIYKSFQDWSKMGASADLGITAKYKFADIFSADLTIRNGEGYKSVQMDNKYRTGLGLTFIPIEGLTIRGFYDYIKDDEAMATIAHFIGYKHEGITVGAEYNYQVNAEDEADQVLSGLSLYGSLDVSDEFEVFARFDNMVSNMVDAAVDNWNVDKDGSLIIAGVQYSPVKQVVVSLNYQGFIPDQEDKDMSNMAYISCQFAF